MIISHLLNYLLRIVKTFIYMKKFDIMIIKTTNRKRGLFIKNIAKKAKK